MSLAALGLLDWEEEDNTLLIDGDIILYRPCCIFNEDDDISRRQIQKYVNLKIDELMNAANCNKYIMFVTTKFNFRDDLVDDYKANRVDVERPVNLSWAKKWAVEKLNNHYHKKLEADDLLGIHTSENTVIWSLDKDLRQIPGRHLDDESQKVITVTHEGRLEDQGKKVYFDGTIGFYYQLLIGDSTDYIVGCGSRVEAVYKSGAKAGQAYIARKGVGPKAAVKILAAAGMAAVYSKSCVLKASLQAVITEYKKLHGEDWQGHLETQANLLFMIREQHGEIIKRWTFDNREEYFCLTRGIVLDEYNPTEATK